MARSREQIGALSEGVAELVHVDQAHADLRAVGRVEAVAVKLLIDQRHRALDGRDDRGLFLHTVL